MRKGRPPRITPDYNQLLEDTVIWAKKNSCVREPINGGTIACYFAKFESTDPNKPIWSDAFPELKLNGDDWCEMMKHARAQNAMIAYEHFCGWYIGNAKDVGKTIASRMNHSTTHLGNSHYEIGLATSGNPPDIAHRLSSGYKEVANGRAALTATRSNIKKMLTGIGIAVKKVISKDYLP